MDNYAIELLHITKVFPGIVGPMDLLVAFLRGPDGERIELLQDRNNAVL